MKAKGLPGDEALKFCLDYIKANQKWPEIIRHAQDGRWDKGDGRKTGNYIKRLPV